MLQRLLQLIPLFPQLTQLTTEVIRQTLLLLLIVDGQDLLFPLQQLNLLEQSVTDELLLLFCLRLDRDGSLLQVPLLLQQRLDLALE